MECKSDMVRRLIAEGDTRKALQIAKGFKLGISKEDRVAMIRGHECLSNPRFYKSLGVDVEEAVQNGLDTLIRLYGQHPLT